MIYNIVFISDIHWGIIDPVIQEERLEYLLIFLQSYKPIDLLVIGGDFWNEKVPLNSTQAISGINWFHRLHDVSKESGIKAVRLFKGTKDHDNSQLEAFRGLEDETNFFRLFNETTSEETLPGLRCIYCPDETVSNDDYMELYLDIILKSHDIGFFHGSFDVVFSELAVQKSESSVQRNVTYQYNFWERVLRGPMIAGHWHNGKAYDHLIYNGSLDRWAFNEEEPKGFSFISYNTDNNKYFYKKIKNIMSPLYLTYEVYTSIANNINAYNTLIEDVNLKLSKSNDSFNEIKIRIVIYIVNESPDNDTYITSLRHYFINDKRVKIQIKNKIKDKKRHDDRKRAVEETSKFDFINDSQRSTSEIIQKFILITKDKEIPLDVIQKRISSITGE